MSANRRNNDINVLEQEQLRTDIPTFRAGDTVRARKSSGSTRERIQVFEGLVIKRQNGGVRETLQFVVLHPV